MDEIGFSVKIKKHIRLLINVVTLVGYLVILFAEKLFLPLQKVRELFIGPKNRDYLEDYIKKFGSFMTRKRDLKFAVKSSRKKDNRTSPKHEDVWVPQYAQTTAKKPKKKKYYGCLTFICGMFFTTLFLLVPSHIYLWVRALPNPDLLIAGKQPVPTRILDRKGRLLYEIFVDRKYEPVKLDKIPSFMVKATLAVEDDDFYYHHGFDFKSTIRAARSTILEDRLQGGSTITQQLVKNVLLSPERTIERKIKELVLAVLVDGQYTKDQILELYLNNISYGGNAWGVQAASQKFFGKNVWELDLAEASLLAGLPSAPSTYSPLGTDDSMAKSRQKYVLDRMHQLGYITRKEADLAYQQTLTYITQNEYIRAPHFVSLVRKALEEMYGRRFVEFEGLTVTTTLDLDLQDKVQFIVRDEVEKSSNLLISNGAAIVMDSRNSEILAYVGSIDYFKDQWGAFDVASGFRQPGSSIKPVTYALALSKNYTPSTLIKDAPVTYQMAGQKPYTPKNYDGQYHGDVTLRAALANSYNIPAVRLANSLGPDNIVQLGKDMGLSNWKVDGSYGLAITLGGKEVRLLDHTNLFATFARKGEYKPHTMFLAITDANNYEVYRDERKSSHPVSEEVSYLIWHILSDNNARMPAFGSRNALAIPGKTVAVKTGTTDLIRDNFTMGFTPSFTVGVWVGNNDNTPLHRNLASGLSGAAPIWNKIMVTVLEGREDELMPRPENVFTKSDKECGQTEIFIKGSNVPSTLCPPKGEKEKDKDKDRDKEKKKD